MDGKPIEWGRLNAGQYYGVLAFDIDRALACAAFSEHEAPLVQYVREHGWGASVMRKRKADPWPDPAPCRVDLTELSRALGVAYQRLHEARNRLVARSVLLVQKVGGNDRYLLNKNAHEWMDTDKKGNVKGPLIPPRKLAYCLAGQRFAGKAESQSVFTLRRENESESVFTPERDPSAKLFTPERDPSAEVFTPGRDPSAEVFTPGRENPYRNGRAEIEFNSDEIEEEARVEDSNVAMGPKESPAPPIDQSPAEGEPGNADLEWIEQMERETFGTIHLNGSALHEAQ